MRLLEIKIALQLGMLQELSVARKRDRSTWDEFFRDCWWTSCGHRGLVVHPFNSACAPRVTKKSESTDMSLSMPQNALVRLSPQARFLVATRCYRPFIARLSRPNQRGRRPIQANTKGVFRANQV